MELHPLAAGAGTLRVAGNENDEGQAAHGEHGAGFGRGEEAFVGRPPGREEQGLRAGRIAGLQDAKDGDGTQKRNGTGGNENPSGGVVSQCPFSAVLLLAVWVGFDLGCGPCPEL